MKKQGVITEYVPEYAKELVWDGKLDLLNGSFENQKALISEQARRIDRLIGKVSVVVTDSPILLGLLYQKEPYEELEDFAHAKYRQHSNFDLLVHRGDFYNFEQAGRIHTPEQCAELDGNIEMFLKTHRIPYTDYRHNESYMAVAMAQNLIQRYEQTKPPKHNSKKAR